jgi:hypothetical protein
MPMGFAGFDGFDLAALLFLTALGVYCWRTR